MGYYIFGYCPGSVNGYIFLVCVCVAYTHCLCVVLCGRPWVPLSMEDWVYSAAFISLLQA